MPNYEFQCNDCKMIFTAHLMMEEQERGIFPVCAHCGSKNVTQLLGSASVITRKKS